MSTQSEMPTHKQLRHVVADSLRTAILESHYRPGQWLRQEKLAQELGVSQMPVREALKELAAEGLVEHVPYRGVRVIEFSPQDVEDLYAHRSFLEGIAARSAAKNITQNEIDELEFLLKRMQERISPEHLIEYRELNRKFHQVIVSASHRDYLTRTLTQLWAAFPSMLWGNFLRTASHSLPARDAADLDEHQAIIEALRTHNAERSEQLTRHHIDSAGAELLSALRNQSK